MFTITLNEREATLLRDLLQWSETFSTNDEEENAELQALHAKLKMMLLPKEGA